jgi:endoglucanase
LAFEAGHTVGIQGQSGGAGTVKFSWSGYLVPVGTAAIGDPPVEGALGFNIAPNPSSQVVTLRFVLARPADVSLAIFDVRGRRVRNIHTGHAAAGVHQSLWDGRDEAGILVAAGTYFARVTSSESESVRKLVRVQ